MSCRVDVLSCCRLELIENEEAEDISKLVFGSIRPLARAAGQFLCTFYFTEDLLSPSFKGTLPKGIHQCLQCVLVCVLK